MSKWKEQIAVGAGTAQLFGRIVVADDADLFGSNLEPGSVFLQDAGGSLDRRWPVWRSLQRREIARAYRLNRNYDKRSLNMTGRESPSSLGFGGSLALRGRTPRNAERRSEDHSLPIRLCLHTQRLTASPDVWKVHYAGLCSSPVNWR